MTTSSHNGGELSIESEFNGWTDTVDTAVERETYDTDLGARVGRDAVRVHIGTMTEEEFYDRYHRELLETLSADRKPMTKTEETNE